MSELLDALKDLTRGPTDPALWILDVLIRGDVVQKYGYDSAAWRAFCEAVELWKAHHALSG